jgi:exodeoxyribonuclease VII large subunit
MKPTPLSLLDLNRNIKDIVKGYTEKKYWVTAEISELKVNYSGHCYLELIQKDGNTDQIIARSRATIWATNFRMIKPYFETTTGQPLTEGLGILVKVAVEFHEVYGLSLNITDIEPTYTVGELAVRKQKIIERLTVEGVIGMNKDIPLPEPCNKIAVVSSFTAAGYEDFVDQLINNTFGFKFYCKLFPAIMQGAEAESSIVSALDKIFEYESFFDCVVIIRGGGSQADLSCFNSYWVAYHITQFPLPVLTGIGHEQDDSVADMVAHTRLKTPTAAAAFLIDAMAALANKLEETGSGILNAIQDLLRHASNTMTLFTKNFQLAVKESADKADNLLTRLKHSLSDQLHRRIHQTELELERNKVHLEFAADSMLNARVTNMQVNTIRLNRSAMQTVWDRKQQLATATKQISALDPGNVLNRGYSITLKNGAVIKDADMLKEGDRVETIFKRGKIETTVNRKIV